MRTKKQSDWILGLMVVVTMGPGAIEHVNRKRVDVTWVRKNINILLSNNSIVSTHWLLKNNDTSVCLHLKWPIIDWKIVGEEKLNFLWVVRNNMGSSRWWWCFENYSSRTLLSFHHLTTNKCPDRKQQMLNCALNVQAGKHTLEKPFMNRSFLIFFPSSFIFS